MAMADIIDLKEVLERVQDDRELLIELFDIFQEDFVGKRQILGDAVKTKDIAKIKEVAHSLKGASGNISAKGMHADFLQIEQMTRNNDLSQADAILKDIDTQFLQLKNFIVQFKKDNKK